jgi:protein SCO1/2
MAVVAFGIDPSEGPKDAAADLARVAKLSSLPVTALVGNEPAIHAVTGALGYRYAYDPRISQYAHLAATAVLTPDGRLVRWIGGIAPEPSDLHQTIADARQGRTSTLADVVALLCYHFDPHTGRYSLAIDRIVQAAGLLTVIILAAFVWRLQRREA